MILTGVKTTEVQARQTHAARHNTPDADELLQAVERLMIALTTNAPCEPVAANALMATNAPIISRTAQNAVSYHLNSGGQKVRARLALHAAKCLGLSADDATAIAAAAELLHNASLIHDDLQDRDVMRRNRQTVWVAFGDEIAICAGDLLLSAAYAALATVSRTGVIGELIALTHARTSLAIRGQCADLADDAERNISIDDYKQIAIAKSGALLSLPIELALTVAGEKSAIPMARQAAESFAIGYQILDDLLDLAKDSTRKTDESSTNVHRPELNVVFILEVSPVKNIASQARTLAKQIGKLHLQRAHEIACQLPRDSGRLLMQFAITLSENIDGC